MYRPTNISWLFGTGHLFIGNRGNSGQILRGTGKERQYCNYAVEIRVDMTSSSRECADNYVFFLIKLSKIKVIVLSSDRKTECSKCLYISCNLMKAPSLLIIYETCAHFTGYIFCKFQAVKYLKDNFNLHLVLLYIYYLLF